MAGTVLCADKIKFIRGAIIINDRVVEASERLYFSNLEQS
jgi:hypothetical protein